MTGALEPGDINLRRWQFGTAWGHEPQPALHAFSAWAERYTNAAPADRPPLIEAGVGFAQERRSALEQLIVGDPETALASTVPFSVRRELPDEVTDLLEERVSGHGYFNVLGATPLPQPAPGFRPILRQAVIGDRSWEASVFGRRLNQRTTPGTDLHGIALDGVIALSDSSLRLLESGEVPPAGAVIEDKRCPVSRKETTDAAWTAVSGTRTWRICSAAHVAGLENVVTPDGGEPVPAYHNQGGQRLLVIRVDFADRPGNPVSPADALGKLAQVNAFFRSNSFQRMWLATVDPTPVLRMPRPSTLYTSPSHDGAAQLMVDARAAASSSGYDLGSYPFDVIAFGNIGFGWAGLGYVGGKGAWVQGDLHPGVTAHELGHNLGLWHAGSWAATSTIGEGQRVEYGNVFDTMGNAWGFPQTHYSANFRFVLGWLTAGNIHLADRAGTYRVHAVDKAGGMDPARRYAIKVPAGISVLGTRVDYWLDYRQLFTANAAAMDGAALQWGNDSGTEKASLLLDTTPGSSGGTDDAPLRNGRTFVDTARNLSVAIVGRGGSGADAYLDVRIGGMEPPPTLADAVDAAGVVWSTGGNLAWSGQRFVSHDGADAVESGAIRDSQESWLETTVVGPGTLSFWWKVSSEVGFDFLKLIVDGREIERVSGEIAWTAATHSLPGGTHTVRWSYTKDMSISTGSDRGWVDQVTFVPNGGGVVTYVDRRYEGTGADGTLTRPFRPVTKGYDPSPACATLRIFAGNYPERRRFAQCARLEAFGGPVRLGDVPPPGVASPEQTRGRFTSPVRQVNGAMGFEFAGESGRRYQLFTSTNLVTWTLWKDFIAEEGTVNLLLPGAIGEPRRFFKSVAPTP